MHLDNDAHLDFADRIFPKPMFDQQMLIRSPKQRLNGPIYIYVYACPDRFQKEKMQFQREQVHFTEDVYTK